MVFERNRLHYYCELDEEELRKQKKTKKLIKAKHLPLCSTDTGTFCWCKKTSKNSEVNKQLGLGMSLYF